MGTVMHWVFYFVILQCLVQLPSCRPPALRRDADADADTALQPSCVIVIDPATPLPLSGLLAGSGNGEGEGEEQGDGDGALSLLSWARRPRRVGWRMMASEMRMMEGSRDGWSPG